MGIRPRRGGDQVAGAFTEVADRTVRAAGRFAEMQSERAESARRRVRALRGKVAVWGAGAKGVTFTNTVDPDGTLVHCVIDINTKKQGGFLPVTAHPIVSPVDAKARGVKSVVIMNPNYRQEIRAHDRDARSRLPGARQRMRGAS